MKKVLITDDTMMTGMYHRNILNIYHDVIISTRNNPRYDNIIEEYKLIKDKKSKLSSKRRASIINRVEQLIKKGDIIL